MNQQDINALTEFWHRETNYLNDSIDSAFKSAQDDAYARGYLRGREDMIYIRKQRDELQRIAERAIEAWDTTVLHAPSDGMMQERMESLRAAIANVKGQQ